MTTWAIYRTRDLRAVGRDDSIPATCDASVASKERNPVRECDGTMVIPLRNFDVRVLIGNGLGDTDVNGPNWLAWCTWVAVVTTGTIHVDAAIVHTIRF